MPNTLGSTTRTYISTYENDKLSMEFAASSPVNKGQPVKFATNGTIVPWTSSDLQHLNIGVAEKTITAAMITLGGIGPAGPLVTVITRAFAIVYGKTSHTNTTLNAGVGTTTGVSTQTGFTDYNEYIASSAVTDCICWIPDQTVGIDVVIRVMMKN